MGLIKIGDLILNKSSIIDVLIDKYIYEAEATADIVVNYEKRGELITKIINVTAALIPDECDVLGNPCEGIDDDEIPISKCDKCNLLKELRQKALSDFYNSIDTLMKDIVLKEFVPDDINILYRIDKGSVVKVE